jgi:hypothetical protein
MGGAGAAIVDTCVVADGIVVEKAGIGGHEEFAAGMPRAIGEIRVQHNLAGGGICAGGV